MKKKLILLPLVCALVFVVMSGYNTGAGRAGIDGTGSTGPAGCSCHNPTPSTATTILIEVLSGGVPVTSYIGGKKYTIRITGTQTSPSVIRPKCGFQLAALKTGTTLNAGALSVFPGTHIAFVSTTTLIESDWPMSTTTGLGGMGSTYVVNVPWSAPIAGAGSVSLFAVMNAVNNDLANTGDAWNNSTMVLPEVLPVAPITGSTSVCVGATSNLSNATLGGTWSSGNSSIAVVGSTSGVVTGVAAGTAVITYDAGGSGTAVATVTVLPSPGPVTGVTSFCAGTSTLLTGSMPGGVWSSGNTAVATIGSLSGSCTGVSAGTATVSYTSAGGCVAIFKVTVLTTPDAGSISGPSTVCILSPVALTNSVTGGVWNTAKGRASVSAAGVVTGITAGTDTIKYAVTNACGTTVAIHPITVKPAGTCNVEVNAAVRGDAGAMSVFPSPGNGAFTVLVATDHSERIVLTITNIVGAVVHEVVGYTNEHIGVELHQPAGLYFISARAGNRVYAGKVVVR